MSRRHIDPKARRRAVVRILSGESDYATECARLGCDRRTLERAVQAAKEVQGNAAVMPDEMPEKGMPHIAGSPLDSPVLPDNAANAALDAALQAARGPDAPPTATEEKQAQVDIQQFCVDGVAQIKTAVVSGVVMFRYSPPLSLEDKAVLDACKLGPIADAAIRTNAQSLYPWLTRLMSGPYQLGAALVLDLFLSLHTLKQAAVAKGWQPKPKDEPAPAEEKKRNGRRSVWDIPQQDFGRGGFTLDAG
jgi:hypothetical protein